MSMRIVGKISVAMVLVLSFSQANSQDIRKWCEDNRRLCEAATNTCESNDELDCDAYMRKIIRGDVADLGKKPERTK